MIPLSLAAVAQVVGGVVHGDGDVEVPWDGTTVGEVCARSNHVMAGYHDAPEATAEVLRDGWLRTGDKGYFDEHGYVYFYDREKDVIKRAGENVSASEVEAALTQHPAVLEAGVVGVPEADPCVALSR